MRSRSVYVNNEGVKIHCIIGAQSNKIPLLIVPGAINSAEQVFSKLKLTLNWNYVIISLRGRGKSSSPRSGYSLNHQASDIVATIKHFGWQSFFLFGHSLGSSVGIRAAAILQDKVKGLIIGDFPPVYPQYSKEWVERVLQIKNIKMSEIAVKGMSAESAFTDLSNDLKIADCPVLVIRGEKTGSLLSPQNAEKICQLIPNCNQAVIKECGHELWVPDSKKLSGLMEDFLIQCS